MYSRPDLGRHLCILHFYIPKGISYSQPALFLLRWSLILNCFILCCNFLHQLTIDLKVYTGLVWFGWFGDTNIKLLNTILKLNTIFNAMNANKICAYLIFLRLANLSTNRGMKEKQIGQNWQLLGKRLCSFSWMCHFCILTKLCRKK